LRLMGVLTGGWLLTRAALAATALRDGGGSDFDDALLERQLVSARFFTAQVLPQVLALAPAVTAGAVDLLAFEP
ncbi:MAG: acyl-CoA dehydrogenase C-terminal domain-containing protein, partial [Actinomycetes bacterium]